MGLYTNLNEIKNIKEQIKQSISDKGIDMSNVSFGDYPTKISEIETGGGDGRLNVKLWGVKFYDNYGLTEVPQWADFTGTEDYSRMFANCEELTNVEGIDWTSAKDTSEMFVQNGKLNFQSIFNNGTLDLPNVTNCHNMFNSARYYYNTGKVNINIPNVGETSRMFQLFTPYDDNYMLAYQHYTSLELVINAPKAKYCSKMFTQCYSKSIDITLGTIENGSYMFAYAASASDSNPYMEAIYLNMTKIKKAGGIFDNAKANAIVIYGDWSQATIDATSFTCYCSNFQGLSQFNSNDLTLPNITFEYSQSRLKNFIMDLGTPTKPLNIYFNSGLESIVDDEIITLALNKNWIISFI